MEINCSSVTLKNREMKQEQITELKDKCMTMMQNAIEQLDLEAQNVVRGLYQDIVELVIDSSDKASLEDLRAKWLELLPDLEEPSQSSIESLEHPQDKEMDQDEDEAEEGAEESKDQPCNGSKIADDN